MMTRRGFGLTGVAIATLSACGPRDTPSEAPGEITFALPTTGRVGRRQDDWRPLLADMESVTGLKVRPLFAPDDAALLESMKQRRIDAGWFSNEAALAAVRSADGEVFSRALGLGAGGDRSVLIVGASSDVSLTRLQKCDKTLRYGRGPQGSAAEDLAPIAYYFGPNNLEPNKCFRTVTTADFEANLAGVARGALDVAAGDSAVLERLRDMGRADVSKVSAIWASPPLPADPLLWRKNLDPELKEELRQFFITDARGDNALAQRQRDHLTQLGVSGFEPADDSHLLAAREIEARVRWAEAQWSGDAARVEASRKALEAIIAERQAVQLSPAGP